MTINQLKENVLALGFEDSITEDMPFIQSVGRALYDITSRFPTIKVKRFIHSCPKPTSRIPIIRHKANSSEEFTLSGKSFSFKVSGVGSWRFTDGESTHEGGFHSEFDKVSCKINDIGKLTLFGSESFTVTDLVTYDDAFGNDDSIPEYSEQTMIKLSELIPDISSPIGAPTDVFGNEIQGAGIRLGYLFLPSDFQGEVSLLYACAPQTVTEEDDTVRLDEKFCHLLPLLVASYMWLDDEEEKAIYYKSLYDKEVERIEKEEHRLGDARIKDVLGWC